MHPCGRFNRNSLQYLINEVYLGEQIRACHRLDANTTGIVLCCRKRSAARVIQKQFEQANVEKTYLAHVAGLPNEDQFTCNSPITSVPSQVGARVVAENGQPAETQFLVLERYENSTLLQCKPITGRTNQIRVHLWHLGLPITGDPLYLAGQQLGKSQTLGVLDPPMRLHAARLEFNHPVTGERISFDTKPSWHQ